MAATRSEEHTSELQSLAYLVCRLLLEKNKPRNSQAHPIKRDTSQEHPYHPCSHTLARSPCASTRCTRFLRLCDLVLSFFFLNVAPPPEFYSLPHHDPLQI